MRRLLAVLLFTLVGGLALPLLSVAEESPATEWRTATLGTLAERTIHLEQFARFLLAMGYFEDRERLINEAIIAQKALERGIVVSVDEIDAAYKEYAEELIAQGEAANEAELLKVNRMSVSAVRESVRLRLALKKLVMLDRKVSDEEAPNHIPLWLEAQRLHAKVLRFSLAKDQPLEYAAEVNGQKIPIERLIREILRRMSDSEVEAFASEVMDFLLLQAHLALINEPITKEDLLQEFERVAQEIAEDPSFNGVPLIDILAAQKKTMDDLLNEPGFILRAMVRKACDSRNPVTPEMEREHYKSNKAEFADREVVIRIISCYHKLTDGTPREDVTRDQAKARADEVAAKLAGGMGFPEAAKLYAEDPGLAETGGKVGAPLKREATLFKFLPELLVMFDMGLGEVKGPIESSYGFHIVKVESFRDRPFEEVQAEVTRSLRRSIREKWLTALRTEQKLTHVSATGVLKVFFPEIEW